MPVAPDIDDVKVYLASVNGGVETSFADDVLEGVLASETAAQSARVDVAGGDEDLYPADLTIALLRRVHRSLQLRTSPLGYQTVGSQDINTRIGMDLEIQRLEAPYRKLVIG